MKAIQKKRLLKLAKHLRSGKLGHKHFTFTTINYPRQPHTCGTMGCAMGELPIVFPRLWRWDREALPAPPKRGFQLRHVASFFGITQDGASHLFYPYSQIPAEYGGDLLHGNATAKQVAANIEAFVKRKEKGGK